MTGNTRLNCYTFRANSLLLFCSKQWNASYGVNNTLCSTIKITSFWLAKQITPICFRIILIIAQICREIAVHNDFQQLRTINGQDLQQAPLLDGCIFLLPSNKSAKIPRPIAFVSCISKCSYMLMERTIVNLQVHLWSAVTSGHLLQVCLVDWDVQVYSSQEESSSSTDVRLSSERNVVRSIGIYISKEWNRYLGPILVFSNLWHSFCNHIKFKFVWNWLLINYKRWIDQL